MTPPMARDAAFAVLDSDGYSYPLSSPDCLPQNKLPVFTVLGTVPSEARQFYLYTMSPAADCGTEMCDAVLGMKQTGFFSPAKGFKKLGLLDVVRGISAAGVAVIPMEQSLDVAAQFCDASCSWERERSVSRAAPPPLLRRDDLAGAVFLGGDEPPPGRAAPK